MSERRCYSCWYMSSNTLLLLSLQAQVLLEWLSSVDSTLIYFYTSTRLSRQVLGDSSITLSCLFSQSVGGLFSSQNRAIFLYLDVRGYSSSNVLYSSSLTSSALDISSDVVRVSSSNLLITSVSSGWYMISSRVITFYNLLSSNFDFWCRTLSCCLTLFLL